MALHGLTEPNGFGRRASSSAWHALAAEESCRAKPWQETVAELYGQPGKLVASIDSITHAGKRPIKSIATVLNQIE